MKRTILAVALAATACIPPAPCRPGLTARLELGCYQIARHIEEAECLGSYPCLEGWEAASEYLDECLEAVEAHASRCGR